MKYSRQQRYTANLYTLLILLGKTINRNQLAYMFVWTPMFADYFYRSTGAKLEKCHHDT